MFKKHTIFFLFSLLLGVSLGREIEREMTIEVGPGSEQCFYETIKSGETLDIEYQVRTILFSQFKFLK